MRQRASSDDVHPWLAVGSVAIGTFVMVTTEFLPIGLLSAIARDLAVSEGRAGLMVTVPGVVAAIAAPVLTIAARNADRRWLLLALTALILASNLLVAFAPGFSLVLAGRVLLGLSLGGFWTFAAAIGRRLVREKDGNRATAIILTGISVGTVLGVPVGTVIGDLAGWRAAFWSIAGLSMAVLFGQIMFLPKLPSRDAATVHDLVALLRVSRAVTGLAATALLAGGHFTAYTYLEPFLTQVAHMPPGGVGWTLAAYGIAGVLGTFAGERACSRDVRSAFLVVAVSMAVAVILAAALGSNAGFAALFVILWGIAFGAVPVCVQIWLYEAAPERFESGSAAMVTVFQLALSAGAFGGGLMVDQGGLLAAFYLGGTLSVLCALLILVASRGGHAAPA